MAAKGLRAAPCDDPIPDPSPFWVVTDVLLLCVGVPTVVAVLIGLTGIRFAAEREEKMRKIEEEEIEKRSAYNCTYISVSLCIR